MTSELVVEVGGLTMETEADAIIEYAVDHGYVGVVVKGSQGSRWVRDDAAQLLTDAQSSMLQGAWLHYAEPAANAAETEAAWLLTHVANLRLGLGVWLELDDTHGLDIGSIGEWVRLFFDATSSHNRPVAITLPTSVGLQISGHLGGRRVILTDGDGVPGITPWGALDDAELTIGQGLSAPLYHLASTRGLIPVAQPAAATVATTAATVVPPADEPNDEEYPAPSVSDEEEATASTGSPQAVAAS